MEQDLNLSSRVQRRQPVSSSGAERNKAKGSVLLRADSRRVGAGQSISPGWVGRLLADWAWKNQSGGLHLPCLALILGKSASGHLCLPVRPAQALPGGAALGLWNRQA